MAIKQVQELENLMQEAFDRKATMLYLMPNEPPAFYIQNSIERSTDSPFTAEQIKEIALAGLGKEALNEIGTEVGMATTLYTLPGIVDARMQVTKTNGQYAITLFMLPVTLPDVECVKIPKAVLDAVESKRGLVLFSGPTGSGKTTSLYSTIDYLNARRACNICMIEHLITYHLTGKKAIIQQREVGTDVPNMMTGISTSIAQHSDVLMIGELRSLEEINLCLMVSQNYLVLTQLHADTPEAAIERMTDVYPEDGVTVPRRILGERLRVACAQTLVERADGKGLVAAYGVLVPDDQMRQDMIHGRNIMDRQTPLPPGCQTIIEDLQRLCQEGTITQQTRDQKIAEFRQ